MIDLLPVPQDRFACPCGRGELVCEGGVIAGMFAFARTRCPICARRFLSRLHTDFVSAAEFHYDCDSGDVATNAPDWYRGQLVDAIMDRQRPAPPVEKESRRPLGPDVVLFDALDPVYGHCLHKLFSYSAVRDDPTVSSLAIVPRFLRWLVPDSIDEVWVVDDLRHRLHLWNQTVADGIANVAASCRRLRFAGVVWGHKVKIADYVGTAPRAAGISPARIVVPWREDRCWAGRREGLSKPEMVDAQLSNFTIVLETLREEIPDLEAYVSGYGTSGRFPEWIKDLRIDSHDSEVERAWAGISSKCHLAIGVHGSNTILPIALAQSGIEIVPANKWPTVQVTWEFANEFSATQALPRYRLLPESSSLSDVATIALAQIRRYQHGALMQAMSAAPTPTDAVRLQTRHYELAKPFAPLICRNSEGEAI